MGGGVAGADRYGLEVIRSYLSSASAWTATIGKSVALGGTLSFITYAICVNAT